MRILQVRFKNLNSLVGEWEINLTAPAFMSDGVFAITGPTGAGKTTILDAICIALYGRTPRLKKVTKSGNEIMSRQTGECFAEVTFEAQDRQYRCHWSQHRARRKPNGELQAPKHEVADADSGKILDSHIRGVASQIESATGMDFDRFTRSMLLAQGEFAEFLLAAPDSRAPILEQITGTEIYSQISIRIHELRHKELEKLNSLQSETEGILILDQEKEIEIRQESEAVQKKQKIYTDRAAEIRQAIGWRTAIDDLKKEEDKLDGDASKMQYDIDAFKPDREKLDQDEKAGSLDSEYATLISTREQLNEVNIDSDSVDSFLPELELSSAEQAEKLKKAEQQTTQVKEELKVAIQTIQEIRILDQKLADQKKAIVDATEVCRKNSEKIDENKKANIELQELHFKAHENLELVENYLVNHEKDEFLISGIADIKEQLYSLSDLKEQINCKNECQEKTASELQQTSIALVDCLKESVIRKQEVKNASTQLKQGKDELSQLLAGRLLKEYRLEKETLLREAALEDHRAKLRPRQPCPLCGSTDHPLARSNALIPVELDQKINVLSRLISEAEKKEATIKKLEHTAMLANENLMEADKRKSEANHNKEAREKIIAEMKESLKMLRSNYDSRRHAVSGKLMSLGISSIPETNISKLLKNLKARLNQWQAKVMEKNDINKQITEYNSEVKQMNAIIQTQSNFLAKEQADLEILKRELATKNKERSVLYGQKNPDSEELRMRNAISDSEDNEKQAKDKHNELWQKWNEAEAHATSLADQIRKLEPKLRKLENRFSAKLAPMRFSNEDEFLEAKLSSIQRDELMAKDKELVNRQTELKTRQQDRKTRLAEIMVQKNTSKSLKELESQLQFNKEILDEILKNSGVLKNQLTENAAAKKRIKKKYDAINIQKQECRRWQALHELIGSSDGKKYRNFAQGLTFELMIRHANFQLEKMTDRYLLIRDDTQPLEINVIDDYQAGEIRTTKNLSGGESFIVSLSLALGLSNMVSNNVRVDSLFLDEGFGTLDEKALDAALETLAGLQHDGKLIGVISHVQALKERISTQIQVTPKTGGKSLIHGPGCQSIGC